MLTRCPACETTFRVSSEQLKARQGKVRCGECQAVFNALDSLVEEFVLNATSEDDKLTTEASAEATTAAATEAAADASPHAAPDQTDAVPQELTFAEDVSEPIADAEPAAEPTAEPIVEHMVAPTAESDAILLPDAPSPPPEIERPPELPPTIGLSDDALAAPSIQAFTAPSVSPPPATRTDDTDHAARDFLADLHVTDTHQGWSAWLWASGIIIAIALLLLQGLIHFRVDIATYAPTTRPLFVSVCSLLGCKVELPRKIEQLSIESSDLHPDPAHPGQSGRLGLQISLRNRAPFAQTWPHIELTLTDLNDRIVVRRMLAAEDYLISQAPTPAKLAQGIAAKQDVAIELSLDIGELTASGYRLYLFYP